MTTYNKEEMFEIKEMFTIWNLCTENVDGLEVTSLFLPNGFLLFDITSSESFCLNVHTTPNSFSRGYENLYPL